MREAECISVLVKIDDRWSEYREQLYCIGDEITITDDTGPIIRVVVCRKNDPPISDMTEEALSASKYLRRKA